MFSVSRTCVSPGLAQRIRPYLTSFLLQQQLSRKSDRCQAEASHISYVGLHLVRCKQLHSRNFESQMQMASFRVQHQGKVHLRTGHEGPERGINTYLYTFLNLGA